MSSFFRMFKHLLPRSKAWNIDTDKNLTKFFNGLSSQGEDIKEYADNVWLDIFPDSTRQIRSWEKQFGLPNNLFLESEKRKRLTGAWRALGGQDPKYIQDTLQENGFDVYLHEWWDEELQTTVIAATTNGVSKSLDGGLSFTNVVSSGNGLGSDLTYRVFMVGQDNVFVCTSNGLSRSDDCMVTFFVNYTVASHSIAGNDCRDVYVTGNNIYLATTTGASISNDDGSNWSNYDSGTTGFGGDNCRAITEDSGTIYVATDAGLSISADNGTSWVTRTTADGLGSDDCRGILYVVGTTVLVPTANGLSKSIDGGVTFTNSSTGLASPVSNGVFVDELGIYYLATDGGLALSTDAGLTWINKTTSNGLGSNIVSDVWGINKVIYASTDGGLSISKTRSLTWVNKTTDNGLGSNVVNGKFATLGVSIFTPKDPNQYLRNGEEQIAWDIVCGDPNIMCDVYGAICGSRLNFIGYPLVNKLLIPDGGGGYKEKTYEIPTDKNTYPYFLYIGAKTFPEIATIPQNRKDEFETLCLKLCPTQQWLGVLVKYN